MDDYISTIENIIENSGRGLIYIDEKGVIRFDDGTSRLLNLNYSMETGILRLIKKTP